MAKKKKEAAPAPGAPAWMATFSDLMNLLLTFFILLFSMSSVDVSKFEEIAASLNASFSIFDSGAPAITEGGLISSGVSQLNQLDNYYTSMGQNQDENDTNEELTEEEPVEKPVRTEAVKPVLVKKIVVKKIKIKDLYQESRRGKKG